MSRLLVKVGGAVAERSAEAVLELARGSEVCVVHGAGLQISLEMERSGVAVQFFEGRRVTTPEGLEIVRSSLASVNAALCAAIGGRATPLFGDRIGFQARPIPDLGLVGDPLPCRPEAVVRALESGEIPVVAPIAVGPLNVNADEAAAALAIGLEVDRLLFLTDVDGLILNGEVVDSIHAEAAAELLAEGELQGGIIPKLGAAVTAARGGIPASIGRTEVIT